MTNLSIHKCAAESELPTSCREEIQKFFGAVRCKAFELFEKYERSKGHDLDNWLEAEKQLLTVPRLELLDKGDSFELRVAVPGFDAPEVEVTALSDSLIVKAQASSETEEKQDEFCCREFSDQSLFRRISLPAPIDINRVAGKVDKGLLRIVAPKADVQRETDRKVSVVAA
jgi:HSP20 family protein